MSFIGFCDAPLQKYSPDNAQHSNIVVHLRNIVSHFRPYSYSNNSERLEARKMVPRLKHLLALHMTACGPSQASQSHPIDC